MLAVHPYTLAFGTPVPSRVVSHFVASRWDPRDNGPKNDCAILQRMGRTEWENYNIPRHIQNILIKKIQNAKKKNK